jgi:hypothetical protein
MAAAYDVVWKRDFMGGRGNFTKEVVHEKHDHNHENKGIFRGSK